MPQSELPTPADGNLFEKVEVSPLVRVVQIDGIAVATLDAPPVNALSSSLRRRLRDVVSTADRDAAIGAIVLIGAGRGFSGGADIREFGHPPEAPSLHDLIETIEACTKPVVAALHGMTLGGGLELALACHSRVAVPSAGMGLPEVKLGLLPGAGGTQRLPRLVGPKLALEMITSGAPIDATTARAAGLIDAITEARDLEGGAMAHARRLIGGILRRTRDLDERLAGFGKEAFEAFRETHARKFRGFAAPDKCIDAVQAAVMLPFEAGLAQERELFDDLLHGPQSVAQRHVFFAERRATRIPDIAEGTATLPIARIGIIGAGTMGAGIAMTFLNAGIPVTIVETEADALDRGLTTIRSTYATTASKGRISKADVESRMASLTGTLDLHALADCDLIIEAVFELMETKVKVFAALDAIAKLGAILASNTSYLDIDMIAGATSRPDHVLGLHFFSPANVMRLLEIVRGAKTSKPVIATAMQLAKKIGKVAVLVGVAHGFVGNRMLAARQREANKLIVEGAMPWDVDRVLFDFGMPMGPFAMADLAGLDLGWTPETSSGSSVRDHLCARGRRGQKTKKGFYEYDESRRATPSSEVEAIILEFANRQGVVRRHIADDEILERCLYPMINEGAKILDEGIALRASDIDVVWVNGYGWPTYRGGPMHYADAIGLDHVLARLEMFRTIHGDDFAPAPLLERLVAAHKGFEELGR